jgi:hypothetical protein
MEHEFVENKMETKTKDDITVPDDVYDPNCADGPVISSGKSTKSTVMASSSVIEQVGDMAGETCDTYASIEEQIYDNPDITGLKLKNPFNDYLLQDSPSIIYETFTELMSLPGCCPKINDTNVSYIRY